MLLLKIALLAGYLTGFILTISMFKKLPVTDKIKEVRGWYVLGGVFSAVFWPIIMVMGFVTAWIEDKRR